MIGLVQSVMHFLNSLQFDVERRNVSTQVEICCAGKPGLLQSTVNTLEALGLEIQQCVISCFNDFTLQASCSEVHYITVMVSIFVICNYTILFVFCVDVVIIQQELEQRTILSSQDIKQALFRSAGYGGRCL